MPEELSTLEWHTYALQQIRALVDKDRGEMSEAELSVYTFANNALAGGPVAIPIFERGPGFRMCRVCGAEWHESRAAEHVSGCPASSVG